MSVTVLDVTTNPFNWIKEDGVYVLRSSSSMALRIKDDADGSYILHAFFTQGYKCDGLSVPKIFRWFLKNWDDSNPLYNLAGVFHDALYGNCGYGIYSRSECDDIFRGMLREAGKDRKHASLADLAVGVFAGSHFGTDNLNCADKVRISRSFMND